MLNMSGITGNRNSTPDANSLTSTLRPVPHNTGSNHGKLGARASADVTSLSGSGTTSRIRPLSEIYAQQGFISAGAEADPQDRLAQQWIADIDQYETTLEEMAAATLDQDFKDELSAIEQWFKVLSEAERTAALYALLQQTTQVQIRFFIQVLQQMGKNHPMSGVLSPANFEKDPMTNRLSDAMNKLNVDSARNPAARSASGGVSTKRHSGLDPSTINAMFPDAAAAIATEKAKFTQQTGNSLSSNRNSIVGDARHPIPVSISEAPDIPASPWKHGADQGLVPGAQPPMGQFVAPSSAGLRSPQPQITSHALNVIDNPALDVPTSPYTGSGNWASMVNTPMTSTFNTAQSNQADMVANATAMKLAALSTVNNRFVLDDVRKYRRARSNDTTEGPKASTGNPTPYNGIIMVTEDGQIIGSTDQLPALQAQQQGGGGFPKPRSSSPAFGHHGPGGLMGGPNSQSPQSHNGFLSAYETPGPSEDYLSDASTTGRSQRGGRGSSKSRENPVDPDLLRDIPRWLRTLRLHKYTENLKDLKWTELVELDDSQLKERGVSALGARRKLVKVFEQVKEAKAEGKLNERE